MKEKLSIQSELTKLEDRVNDWIELTEKTFRFATYAKHWFNNGDFETKTAILRALGSNFILNDQNISISLAEHCQEMNNLVKQVKHEISPLELSVFELNKAKTTSKEVASVVLSG